MKHTTVPFFSLAKQWADLKSSTLPKMEAILDTQAYVGGAAITDFETSFAQYVGATHAIGCSSGTSALWLALQAVELQKNSIVLTTPFSFIASSSEIYAHGAHPVFIDIDEQTLNISPEKVAEWLLQNSYEKDGCFYEHTTNYPIVGMVVVNIFGLTADYTALNTIKKQYNLWIIEDAAQSIGASHDGIPSGSLGDISCFSFYPTKNLGACGDAGMVTTSSDIFAERLYRLRNHGRHSHYHYEGYGINGRLDALQAIVLSEKLTHLPTYTQNRRRIASFYQDAFSLLLGITTPPYDATHTYHQYTIQIDATTCNQTRDQLAQKLLALGIETRIFYPQLLSDIPYLMTDERLKTICPIAHKATQQVLSLPIWPELGDDAIRYVIAGITESLYQPHEQSPALPGITS